MSELTLPGDIPGLLRRGSPVVFRSGGHVPGTVAKFADHKGITDVPWVWWEPHNEPNGVGKPSLRNSILLDLSDPTGRLHALLWLTTCDVAALESIADDMTGPIVDALYWAWAGWEDDTGAPLGWELNLWNARYFFLNDDLLVDLNHRDVDTLADGSRAVDAEALRRIVLHVAGRE